jgi:hypothetical protein
MWCGFHIAQIMCFEVAKVLLEGVLCPKPAQAQTGECSGTKPKGSSIVG